MLTLANNTSSAFAMPAIGLTGIEQAKTVNMSGLYSEQALFNEQAFFDALAVPGITSKYNGLAISPADFASSMPVVLANTQSIYFCQGGGTASNGSTINLQPFGNSVITTARFIPFDCKLIACIASITNTTSTWQIALRRALPGTAIFVTVASSALSGGTTKTLTYNTILQKGSNIGMALTVTSSATAQNIGAWLILERVL